jgi:hypothetical protein
MSKENKETNKRVRINEDGILTITNDNATWVNGDVTTDINGDYNISANDLRRLMVMMTGQDMIIRDVHTWWYVDDYKPKIINNTVITTNTAVAEEIEAMHKAYDERTKSEKVARYDYNELREKVEKFNKTRRWWERKIAI